MNRSMRSDGGDRPAGHADCPRLCWHLAAAALLFLPSILSAAVDPALPAAFPPSLESYQDAHLGGIAEVLKHRVEMQPFNLLATLLFFGAVVHTFFTQRFRHYAHVLAERHSRQSNETAGKAGPPRLIIASRILHFLGEVEAVFGIWALLLGVCMTIRFGSTVTADYFNHHVNYSEPLFVVVIMAMSATRPVLRLAEQCLKATARLTGGGIRSWWFSILTIGPVLGSLITEPAAMTIAASLLAARFYSLKPRAVFAYATLGLLFVNVSIGGTLTHFAAPPVLMVAARWDWGTGQMLIEFGWKAVLAIVLSNTLYFFIFRKDFARLGGAQSGGGVASLADASAGSPIPLWVTITHLLFMALAVLNAHIPALLIGSFLFFMAFVEVTEDYQAELQLRPAILVGFFLAGLVIHGGLQQWWIGPVLGKLQEVPLLFCSMGLTAFNDNAAITYLATLVPDLSDAMKYAVVAGAVAGGGLTVIANAPNPAGQALLNKYFPDGISPMGLLLGALAPTVVCALCFLIFR
jgi:hypothetical protein